MKIAVCTLFEKEYHKGVAVLLNSLCKVGFRGTMYAGYRGDLPQWADAAKSIANGCKRLDVFEGVEIIFVPLETKIHFTNYKPSFMLDLLANQAADVDVLCYMDPDIVVARSWEYLEDWLSCGVAVCEDVNSPVQIDSPRRIGWRRYYEQHNIQLRPRMTTYANGGFVAVPRVNIDFIHRWQHLLQLASESLGGSDVAGVSGGRHVEGLWGFANCFSQPDQDALNATIESMPEITVSFEGKQAMGIEYGFLIVAHALGKDKPWSSKYLQQIFVNARTPCIADKEFWDAADGPIKVFPKSVVRKVRMQIKLASFVGRYVKRN